MIYGSSNNAQLQHTRQYMCKPAVYVELLSPAASNTVVVVVLSTNEIGQTTPRREQLNIL